VVVRLLRERTLLAFVPGVVVVVRSGQSPVLVEAVEEPFFVVVPLHDVIRPSIGLVHARTVCVNPNSSKAPPEDRSA
jgi:hypothetical protein